MMAEGLAGEDVGEMHLDHRQADGPDGIVEGDRGVGVGAGIEDDARGASSPASWIQSTSTPSWLVWRKSTVRPSALAGLGQSFSISASVPCRHRSPARACRAG